MYNTYITNSNSAPVDAPCDMHLTYNITSNVSVDLPHSSSKHIYYCSFLFVAVIMLMS